MVSKEKLLHKYFDFVLKFLNKTPAHHIHGGFGEEEIKAIRDIQGIRGVGVRLKLDSCIYRARVVGVFDFFYGCDK